MSDALAPQQAPDPDSPPTTAAGRLDALHRAGGIAVPIATVPTHLSGFIRPTTGVYPRSQHR